MRRALIATGRRLLGWFGKPNHKRRRLFERGVANHFGNCVAPCILAVRVDRYASVAQSLGFGVANQLTRAVRERLAGIARIARIERLGDDTFGLLVDAEYLADVVAAVERLPPDHALQNLTVATSLTIGSAGPIPFASARDLVEMAQTALEEACRLGRRRVDVAPRDADRIRANLQLMNDLRDAMTAGDLELHYQPKLCSRSGAIDSLEALLRWHHPNRGSVSPADFIPIAEQSGDIRALTLWVLDQACRDADLMTARGVDQRIYINISAPLIGDAEFADRMLATLAGQDGRIGIEITETAVLDSPERALANLARFAAVGISIAIDDYGVGLSSLNYLKQMPATELKIDMSFIRHLTESHRDPMIVRSTIDLAHGLGLRVTAEGVDKPETLALLKVMGCDLLQGYHISPALPLDALLAFLQHRPSPCVDVPVYAANLRALASG